MVCRVLVSANLLVGGVVAIGQEPSGLPDAPSASQSQSAPSSVAQRVPQHEPSKNHIFWIIPNYRSDENAAEIKPLTSAEKMKVALDDSFDPSAFLVAGIFAGLSMAQKQYSSFGTGAQGLSSRSAPGSSLFCKSHRGILETNWICDEPGSYHSRR
jgi:hypothetical protein